MLVYPSHYFRGETRRDLNSSSRAKMDHAVGKKVCEVCSIIEKNGSYYSSTYDEAGDEEEEEEAAAEQDALPPPLQSNKPSGTRKLVGDSASR